MKMTDDGIQDEEISPLNALEHVHFKLIQITLIFQKERRSEHSVDPKGTEYGFHLNL